MKHNDVGKFGEDQAVKFLKKSGYRIVERNVHMSHNEIDIIAKNKEFLLFVEVKTRSVGKDLFSDYGTPAEAVTLQKQKRIITAAKDYLYSARSKKYSSLQPRFDIIEVYLERDSEKILKINHFEDAFYNY